MSSLTPHRLLLASLLSLGFATGLSALPAPAHAQSQRAYAPEDLWTLSTSEQTRVISLEYREQSNGRQIPNESDAAGLQTLGHHLQRLFHQAHPLGHKSPGLLAIFTPGQQGAHPLYLCIMR